MKLPNTIINFHVIKNSEWMEDVVLLLRRHYNFVSATDLENSFYKNQELKNACHITIDDGDLSVYTHLFPVIKKYNVPISIFVSPLALKTGRNFWFQEIQGFDMEQLMACYNEKRGTDIKFVNAFQVFALLKSLEGEEIYSLIDFYKSKLGVPSKPRIGMNIEQLLELKASGLVEIGAHTQTHPILKNESDEKSRYEIMSSIEELGDILGEKVRSFAYPNGIFGLDFSQREVEILRECNIKLAYTTETNRFSSDNNPLCIPRFGITKGTNGFILTKLIFGSTWVKLRRMIKGKQEFDYRVD